MSSQPILLDDHEDYLDHEIRIRVFGPIKTNPNDPTCKMAHYSVTVAIFKFDKEIQGARDTLQGQYPDVHIAQNSAFHRGREIVNRIMALP